MAKTEHGQHVKKQDLAILAILTDIVKVVTEFIRTHHIGVPVDTSKSRDTFIDAAHDILFSKEKGFVPLLVSQEMKETIGDVDRSNIVLTFMKTPEGELRVWIYGAFEYREELETCIRTASLATDSWSSELKQRFTELKINFKFLFPKDIQSALQDLDYRFNKSK